MGQTGSRRGWTDSNQVSIAAGRLLDESAAQIRCRVSGAPLPHLLERFYQKNYNNRKDDSPKWHSCLLPFTHLHLKDWSWKQHWMLRQIWADGARRQAPPLPLVQPAACSWLPQEQHLFGSTVQARGRALPGGEGESGRSDPLPRLYWPPLLLGWADCESHLKEFITDHYRNSGSVGYITIFMF